MPSIPNNRSNIEINAINPSINDQRSSALTSERSNSASKSLRDNKVATVSTGYNKGAFFKANAFEAIAAGVLLGALGGAIFGPPGILGGAAIGGFLSMTHATAHSILYKESDKIDVIAPPPSMFYELDDTFDDPIDYDPVGFDPN